MSCREHLVDAPLANQTPKTALWLYPQTEIRPGVSKEQLYWWGEDPDGVVRGYLFGFRIVSLSVTSPPSPDTMRYDWTAATDTTILFPLDTLFRRFAFTVRAVDNTFGGLPEHAAVRISPFPYWDVNDNGVFDSGDMRLDGLPGAMDPAGRTLTFPVVNSPPTVSFVPNPLDPTIPQKQPDTTFTAVTFSWTASDPDGNNTLRSYRIALNDTSDPSSWFPLSLRDSLITLVVPRSRSDAAAPQPGAQVQADVYSGSFLTRRLLGQIGGLRLDAQNMLIVQVRDVAGQYSQPITMPSGTDRWFVKRPRGRLLIVNDYINSDGDLALSTYLRNLANIPPPAQFSQVDILNIGAGLSASDKNLGKAGPFTPPFVDPALIQTFLLYDYIFWYTDQFPSLATAQLSLFTYMQNGGKVLFSTTFQSGLDPRAAFKDFAPIDSISSAPFTPRPAPGDTRIPVNYRVYADSSGAGAIYPQLAFIVPNPPAPFHFVFMRPIYRRSDARYIYHLQPDTANSPPRYIGMPNIAAVDGQRTIVFVGLPLHLLDNTVYGNPLGLQAFFNRVFTQEFNPLHKVNRAKF
ncbi:MAG TPA: hypothetical protein VK569_00770 [Bacteroidota bacterium]|nr:hypothetical protein [Bacteroidota bacterium]